MRVSDSVFLSFFYVILSVFDDTVGFSSIARNFTTVARVSRQARICEGFQCTTSRECIGQEKRCDGNVDCADGSDEFNDCKETVKCPGFLFTCDYGACVEMSKKCNGKKDCRDNSDEANCIDSTNVEKISSNCKSDQFECKSGQCISLDDKCDGKTDCDDRSDETKEACLNTQCPGWTFKCDYGACVDGFAKCNNKRECVDNSDEEDCFPLVTPTPTPAPTPTPTPDDVEEPTEGCTLPQHPQFGTWEILGNANGIPFHIVKSSTLLRFNCNNGFELSTEHEAIVCNGNEWTPKNIPTCVKKCRPFYSTKFTTIRCFNSRNIEIKCDEATEGAFATFQCAPYYESKDAVTGKRYCNGGSWSYPEPVCEPVCGEKKVTAEPLIVNAQVVEKGNYPWVTAIYQKQKDGSFLNVCGGSMLTQKLILTAAHCVTDDNGNLLPTENVIIAVGKYYNKYKDPRDTEAQYSELDNIIIPDSYKGEAQRYAFDIALLVAKEVLLLSKVVQPVCYLNVANIHLNMGSTGVVTGWGYTVATGQPSEVLREVDVPYKDDSECNKELPSEWAAKYYTFDKMCAGHYNRSISVCRGDSGSGLVFKQDDRYYIHGIVSLGHGLKGGCNIQVSSLYTKVSKHYDWLEQNIAKYKYV